MCHNSIGITHTQSYKCESVRCNTVLFFSDNLSVSYIDLFDNAFPYFLAGLSRKVEHQNTKE